MLVEKSIKYAKDVIAGKEITTNEVKWECQRFLDLLKEQKKKSCKYYFDEEKLETIDNLLKVNDNGNWCRWYQRTKRK